MIYQCSNNSQGRNIDVYLCIKYLCKNPYKTSAITSKTGLYYWETGMDGTFLFTLWCLLNFESYKWNSSKKRILCTRNIPSVSYKIRCSLCFDSRWSLRLLLCIKSGSVSPRWWSRCAISRLEKKAVDALRLLMSWRRSLRSAAPEQAVPRLCIQQRRLSKLPRLPRSIRPRLYGCR